VGSFKISYIEDQTDVKLNMNLNRKPELDMVKNVLKMDNKLYNDNQLIDHKYTTYNQLSYDNGKVPMKSFIGKIDF